MKKVCIFTSTRADYGLLYWLMKDIDADPDLSLQLIVTGAHLSPEFGLTYRQIEADGFTNIEKVPMQLSGDDATATIKSVGVGLIGVADALARLKPDVAVLLGDRYETLGFAQATLLAQIPTVHLHGGELTYGAQDDAIRHAITKLCDWHCAATESYCQRIIQLGEQPERVHCVGALGLEHLRRTKRLSRKELSKSLNFDLERPFFVLSFHPETLFDHDLEKRDNQADSVLDNLMSALIKFSDHAILMSYPNTDQGHQTIIEKLRMWQRMLPDRFLLRESFGTLYYLSAMEHADVVIGNSSSAILEAPSLKTASVNVGNRQGGRIAADSVIHCGGDPSSIKSALEQALDKNFQERCKTVINPYDRGNTTQAVIRVLKFDHLREAKRFNDIEFQTSS